ncbi:MAG TPA: hypothetical protein VHG89_08205 [Verrucomicrobiae bacterium]|nr:hypothetical protein [Verrucomicrobiae bacterium]
MKKINRLILHSSIILFASLAILNFGCEKKPEASATETTPIESKSPAITPAVKTSFNEVTSQLDSGGNFYLYLGTAQWLDGLSTKISGWRDFVDSAPDLKPEDRENVDKAFTVLTHLIKDSGVEDVTGVGLSSVEIENGLYHNKALLHHYPGKGSGFLWKFMGGEPHALTGLDFCPTNTALSIFSDGDLPLLWSVAQQEIGSSKIPQAQEWLQKLPELFEQKTQVKWDKFLDSIGGEFGIVITLDDSHTIPIPLPSGALEIPEPGLLFVVKINDDTIFNRVDEQLKKNPRIISVNQANLKMRTVPVPIPLPINLRPTVASSGGYLFIASSDALINEALAVKSGQKPGLKSTDEFKHLSQNIPNQGNQFAFVSERFGKTMFEIQTQTINAAAARNQTPGQAQWIQSLFRNRQPAYSYSVGVNTDEGCLTVGNGNQSAAAVAVLPAVAVSGMMAAIAVPNFVKARATSQRNACINNLRQIDAAKQQWALEKNKKGDDVPTWDDLKPYLYGSVPLHCPAGGEYTINAVSERPTCSIAGHQLP